MQGPAEQIWIKSPTASDLRHSVQQVLRSVRCNNKWWLTNNCISMLNTDVLVWHVSANICSHLRAQLKKRGKKLIINCPSTKILTFCVLQFYAKIVWFHNLHYTACFMLSFTVIWSCQTPGKTSYSTISVLNTQIEMSYPLPPLLLIVSNTSTLQLTLQHSTLSATPIKVSTSQIHGMNLRRFWDSVFWDMKLCHWVSQ